MDARRFQSVVGLLLMLSIAFNVYGQNHGLAPDTWLNPIVETAPGANYSGNFFAGNAGPTIMPPSAGPVIVGHPMMAQSVLVQPVFPQPLMEHAVIPWGAYPAISMPLGSAALGSTLSHATPTRVGRVTRGPSHQPSVANSENFIIFASDAEWAAEVADTAEQLRRDLAVYWLGKELPPWSQRCPLHVQDAANLGAGGETRFALSQGSPGNWMMTVQGTRQRILDSVLPHEITHTIFATHFGKMNKYVPRWADEGASTTVEHEAEKKKHRHFLHQFLKTGRGLAFNEMFRLKEYPQDILPLYAQGHSAVQFLLDQAGPRQFIQFIEMGMMTENWPAALQKFYLYESIGDFQINWNQWLRDGSPADLTNYAPRVRKQASDSSQLASGTLPSASFVPLDQVATSPVSHDDSESWFKRKLRETSGTPATNIPPHNHFTGEPAHGLRASVSASRTKAAQAPGIQALEWPDAGRISNIPDVVSASGTLR